MSDEIKCIYMNMFGNPRRYRLDSFGRVMVRWLDGVGVVSTHDRLHLLKTYLIDR